jgi:hypothetical protein
MLVTCRNLKADCALPTECILYILRVTLHVYTCSGLNRITLLMRRPNTDSTPNKPVTLRGHEFRPHCHDTVLRCAVTLQVCNPVTDPVVAQRGGRGIALIFQDLGARRG